MTTDTLTKEAFARGEQAGTYDAQSLAEKNHAPLSGEWAGESMVELIGDLIENAENDEHCHEICQAYEDGYSHGYDNEVVQR